MISSQAVRQSTYGTSRPNLTAISPKLAKETVYMPSKLAALVLGKGNAVRTQPAEE
jgi:hypothetical protein